MSQKVKRFFLAVNSSCFVKIGEQQKYLFNLHRNFSTELHCPHRLFYSIRICGLLNFFWHLVDLRPNVLCRESSFDEHPRKTFESRRRYHAENRLEASKISKKKYMNILKTLLGLTHRRTIKDPIEPSYPHEFFTCWTQKTIFFFHSVEWAFCGEVRDAVKRCENERAS